MKLFIRRATLAEFHPKQALLINYIRAAKNSQSEESKMGKDKEKEEKKGDKPAFKVRVGNVTATVWKNVYKKDGNDITMHNTDIIRSYLDKDENWQTTSSFGLNDLHKVIAAAQKAYEFITVKTEEKEDE